MRSQSRRWVETFGALASQSARLWWTLLPKLLLVFVPTYTITRLLEMAAAAVGTLVTSTDWEVDTEGGLIDVTTVTSWNQWLAVALVALSFLVTLIGTIICWRMISEQVRGSDVDPRQGLTTTLSVTMLGFLGIYSVFDEIDLAANRVLMDGAVLSRGDLNSLVFIPLYPKNLTQTLTVVAVIVAAFVLRRVAEQVGEHKQIPALGFVAAALEAFYLLVAFVVGRRLLGQLYSWLMTREFTLWVEDAFSWLTAPFRWLGWSIPEMVAAGVRWFLEVGWPLFVTSLAEPLLWLALAGLAMGGQVHTFRGLLEAGHTPGWVARTRRDRLVDRAMQHTRVVATAQDAVFGDLDDKYLPFFQLLRLTLGVGGSFLGAFIVGYATLGSLREWVSYELVILIGPLPLEQQMFWQSLSTLFVVAVFEPLRLCLLAVAYMLAVSANTPRGSAETVPQGAVS